MCSPSSRGDGGGVFVFFSTSAILSQDEDVAAVRWRDCRARIRSTYGPKPLPRRDINAVLAAHDRQLLELPDVVGVYVGVLADGKMPCLKVMLARPTPETERKLPREIEGYPVVAEISGEIRPLRP